jgi:hypothetical protein
MVRECIWEACAAAAITCLISLMPLITAENSMKLARVVSAMILASVVLPTPGGPQKIMEPVSSRSICTRSGLPGPTRCSWPLSSSSCAGASARPGARCGAVWGLRVRRQRGSSLVPSLPRGLVEQHAGGDGGVQALDRAGAGNRHRSIGLSGQLLRHAVALIADDERHRPGQVDAVGGFGSFARRWSKSSRRPRASGQSTLRR